MRNRNVSGSMMLFACARRIAFVLAMCVLGAAGTYAADATVYLGGVLPGKLSDAPSPSSPGIETSFDAGYVWGFRIGTDFIPWFGMEHTLGFSSDFLFPKLHAPSIAEAKGFVYNSNLIFHIPVGNAVPYITTGIGLIHQYGSGELPVGTKFAVNYGGGLKLPRLAGPFGLRLDARGYTATGLFSGKLNIFEISGGILLSLGR